MAQATITAKVEDTDKAAFSAFCASVGLNTSTAINLYIKAVLREKRIPFSITQEPDPFYSIQNIDYVLKSVKELKSGQGKPHDLIEDHDE